MINGNLLYKRIINNTSIKDIMIGKINRYYISNQGYELIKKLPPLEKDYLTSVEKHKLKVDKNQINIFDFIEDNVTENPDDREENLEAGWLCTLFNKFENKKYDINYNYYINECNKIINAVNSK